jgi:Tol biopolymer transport system component
MTFDPADNLDSIWSPDGTRIAFTSNRMGPRDIYQTPADGSGPAELLLGGQGGQKNVEDWSQDGKIRLLLLRSISMCCLWPATGSPCLS